MALNPSNSSNLEKLTLKGLTVLVTGTVTPVTVISSIGGSDRRSLPSADVLTCVVPQTLSSYGD